MARISRRAVLAGALAAPFLARHGHAQSDWPKGPVRWIVAYAAGGAADTVARNVGRSEPNGRNPSDSTSGIGTVNRR